MSIRILACIAAACLGVAGCATTPTDNRARMVNIPLAAAHANIGFNIVTAARLRVDCGGEAHCLPPAELTAAAQFELQVQRIADVLQNGARRLYPDLASDVPGLAESRFEVYVVEDAAPGSASSANGRIALNSSLGAAQPYDDWLAFIIAREMGHVIARHHEENSASSIVTSVIMNVLIPGSSLMKSAITMGGSRLAVLSKRDVQTQEADAIARQLLIAAGFSSQDVALSLRIAPEMRDGSQWSRNFRQSADDFRGGKPGLDLLAKSSRQASTGQGLVTLAAP